MAADRDKRIAWVALPSLGGRLVRPEDMTREEAIEAIGVLGEQLRMAHENAVSLRPLRIKPRPVPELVWAR